MIYFIANSSLVLQKVAEEFAPRYDISYTRIYGNALTGVKIAGIEYKGEALLANLVLRWNPLYLLDKALRIDTLKLENLNINTLKSLLDTFSSSASTNSPTIQSKSTLDFVVSVESLAIDIEPFVEQNITFRYMALGLEDISYDNATQNVDITQVLLSVESNLAKVNYKAQMLSNTLKGQVVIVPFEGLFQQYLEAISPKAIKEIRLDLNLSKEQVRIGLDTQILQLLEAKKDAFNVDIASLRLLCVYDINSSVLKADIQAIVDTPYAKDILVENHLTFDGNLSYRGTILLKEILAIEPPWRTPLRNLRLVYRGNAQHITSTIEAQNLSGHFILKEFKQGVLSVKTSKEIILEDYLTLPSELNQTRGTIEITVPIVLEAHGKKTAEVGIRSNVVNIDANLSYDTNITLLAEIIIPQKSLLKSYSDEVKWEKISPLFLDVTLEDKTIHNTIRVGALGIVSEYDMNSSVLSSKMKLQDLEVLLSGKPTEELRLETQIVDMSEVKKSIEALYEVKDMPKLLGDISISLTLSQMKALELNCTSSYLGYGTTAEDMQEIKNINLRLSANNETVIVEQYELEYQNQKIFSNKPSTLGFSDNTVRIKPFWINDSLKIEGNYSIEAKAGVFSAKSERFDVTHPIIELQSRIDIEASIKGKQTDIKGKITLLGGDIHYDMSQKSFASDSDIVILQEIKVEDSTEFMDNLNIDIQVDTQKPLRYYQGNIHLESSIELGIYKASLSEIILLGSVEVPKGGTYVFQDKTFVFARALYILRAI
ncbi:MAG: hypothetical protein Q9M36_11665 [Sulfurovum sp.]|nr:hypothetical protein [Sulfurovum sp.]